MAREPFRCFWTHQKLLWKIWNLVEVWDADGGTTNVFERLHMKAGRGSDLFLCCSPSETRLTGCWEISGLVAPSCHLSLGTGNGTA